MPPWYYPAEAFDAVYAVSDLHGDVEVALSLFCNVLAVVERRQGFWVWSAPPRTCVVICGDTVDRSRRHGHGGPLYGENDLQDTQPDDLYLLRLLNHWAFLADTANNGGKLLRLIGNHEVHGAEDDGPITYVSTHSARLLWRCVERLVPAPKDPNDQREKQGVWLANRRASFSTLGGAYFRAIWYERSAHVLIQIGPFLFTHAGVTHETVDCGIDPDDMRSMVREYMLRLRPSLPTGVQDIMFTRQYNTTSESPNPGVVARSVVDRWTGAFDRHTSMLVVGHNATTPGTVYRASADAAILIHTRRVTGSIPRTYDTPEPAHSFFLDPAAPWINASADDDGRPSVWRVDVAASRAWWTVDPHWVVWPQALRCNPQTGETAAVIAEAPIGIRLRTAVFPEDPGGLPQ
jgi:hypothetical protein